MDLSGMLNEDHQLDNELDHNGFPSGHQVFVPSLGFDPWVSGVGVDASPGQFATGQDNTLPAISDIAFENWQNAVGNDWPQIVTEQDFATNLQIEQSWQDVSSSETVGASNVPSDVETPTNSATTPGALSDGGQKVCYGMLFHSEVKLVGDMESLLDQLKLEIENREDGINTFTLLDNTDHITLKLSNDAKFGYLDTKRTEALLPLLSWGSLEFEAIAPYQKLFQKINKVDKVADARVHVDINIYGPSGMAAEVADILTTHKAWLQKPDYHKPVPYENPHVLKLPGYDTTNLEEIKRKAFPLAPTMDDTIQDTIRTVQASTSRDDNLEAVASSYDLQTELLPHQMKALNFMQQRESGKIQEAYRLWTFNEKIQKYVHRITGTRCNTRPDEKGGGVLADDMGMGKSLSILALVVNTLVEGKEWATRQKNEDLVRSDVETYAHSTLVIVPSELLINGWNDEISIHLGDKIKVTKYHGGSRLRDTAELAKADIVLTTYKTLATDFTSKKGVKSPLHAMSWFRVVLDEAHNIRRPATTFHRACAGLHTRSRWCLTGTPIQNRLEDIGALFVFLQTDQFRSMARFRYYLVSPFEQGQKKIAEERLIMLYDSFVLRRTKDILDLPGRKEIWRKLRLSDDEEKQYDHSTDVLKRCIANRVSHYNNSKNFGLFHVHLQLRLLCNHGTHQRLYSWQMNGGSSNTEAREARLAKFGTLDRVCDGCSQPRPIMAASKVREDYLERCQHTFCSQCSASIKASPVDEGTLRHCPLCELAPQTLKRKRTRRGREAQSDESGTEEDEHSWYFHRTGESTKMKALVADVKKTLNETVVHKDGSSGKTKSIIFSCWTRTLDLIEMYLKGENIEFLRIDGECLMSKRQERLDEFSKTDGKRIMLMTTGTGAFGLNLTAANRVFIVELQWNPSVEDQAISRAIRLRQNTEVVVTRYLMLGTVEDDMGDQQKQKKLAAKAGFDQGNKDEVSEDEVSEDEMSEDL